MATEKSNVRRHPPQLHRQMEQEDSSMQPTSEHRSTAQWKPNVKKSENSPAQSNDEESHAVSPSHLAVRQKLPPTQDSQGSSSTGSGVTAMSLGTSGGSMSSGKSARHPGKFSGTSRGTRCSSSASSSTEETEARERRFGSLDLHPLPTVASTAAMALAIRRSLLGSGSHGSHHLHCNALLTMHQRFSSQSEAATDPLDCHDNHPPVPTVNSCSGYPGTIMEPTALPTTSLANKSESGPSVVTGSNPVSTSLQNPVNLFGVLPSSFWPCLLCPIHGAALAHSSALLLTDKEHEVPNSTASKGDPTTPSDPLSRSPDLIAPRGSNESSATDQCSVSMTQPGVPSLTAATLPESHLSTSAAVDKCFESGATTSHPAPHIGPYQLGPTLGRGNFAVVKLAKHIPTKMKVAIKIMNKELIGSNNLNKVSRELEAMKRCQHPHIVRLYHVMETESSIFMVTEYASKGEVFDHISISRAFSEKEARELFWQIVCAIDFCHNSGVVHRDLKAENLLLDSEFKIKVADFGFCNFFKPDELLSTHCGSPQYAAPELFKGEPYDGPLADVWSLGVILYILVCGSFPFPGESLGDIRSQVLRGLVRFPFFLSTACEQVIRCMLQVDPAKRFKLRQVIATQWMQASPNVEHYRALMARYESKAKERQFDELFRSQYPEHSELVRVYQVEQAQHHLDCGVLRALAVGVGFDEEQIRFSSLQNKCDRWHAAYQLLRAKIRRFRLNPHLCQYVDEAMHSSGVGVHSRTGRRRSGLLSAWRSNACQTGAPGATGALVLGPPGPDSLLGSGETEGSCLRHTTPLATVPDVMDEAMAEVEQEDEVKSQRDATTDWLSAGSTMNTQSASGKSSDKIDSALKTKYWKDPQQPNSTDFNVALFILKADEDLIMTQLGLTPTNSVNPSGLPTVRRHTVQLTGSPLNSFRPPPPPPPTEALVQSSATKPDDSFRTTGAGACKASDVASSAVSPVSADRQAIESGVRVDDSSGTDAVLSHPSSGQRVMTHRFPRQTTQPHIGAFQQLKNKTFQPEQLIRTALDWLPSPWGSSFQAKNSAHTEADSDRPQLGKSLRNTNTPSTAATTPGLSAKALPSLELGDEALTSEPPNELRRVRPGLQRGNSVQEFEDEVDTPGLSTNQSSAMAGDDTEDDLRQLKATEKRILAQSTLDNTPAFVANAGQLSYDVSTAQETLLNLPVWSLMVRDSVDFGKHLNNRGESEEQKTVTVPTAMETDVPEGSSEDPNGAVCPYWPATLGESRDSRAADDEVCDPAPHLGTLLPQLNLPANLPAMIHQPVARFTVKDPHLLAPPDFMTPHCSSFPRRSSDGAAELQPLHRPALTVGGSYPEQTNYRAMHASTEDTSGTLVPPSTSVCYTPEIGMVCSRNDGNTPTENMAFPSAPAGALKPCDSGATAACELPDSDGLTATGVPATTTSPRSVTARQVQATAVRARATLRTMHSVGSRARTGPFPLAMSRSPAVLAAQQRSILSHTQPTPIDRTGGQPVGRKQLTSDVVSELDTWSEAHVQSLSDRKSAAVQAQLARYRKRFSLPAGYRPVRQVTLSTTGTQNMICLCNHPLTPDLIQHVQSLIHCQSGQVPPWDSSASPALGQSLSTCPMESSLSRRGSEASQLLAWKHRLNQCAGLFEPTAPEPAFGQNWRPFTHFTPTADQPTSCTIQLDTPPSDPVAGSNTTPLRLSSASETDTTGRNTQTHSQAVETDPIATLSLASNVAPTSPPGIELNALKTELHKLETENNAVLISPQVAQLPVSSVVEEDNGSTINSSAASLSSTFTSGSRAGDARRHYMNSGRRYQRSPENSTSPLRGSPNAKVSTHAARGNFTLTETAFRHRTGIPHRVSSLKVPRRASSAVAGSTGRGQPVRHSSNGNPSRPGFANVGVVVDETIECSLPRRHRYSVGDSLDQALITMTDDLNCSLTVPPNTPPYTPLSCQPSVTGLHSQPNQHRAIAPTLSNPDHTCSTQLGAYLLSGLVIPTDDHDRTALSSPGPAGPILDLSLGWSSQAQPQIPVAESEGGGVPSSVTGPSSAGVKRRLLAPTHGKSNDHLRTLQRAGGSLDRRLNFDLFNSPKRKVYQEWLSKVAAFSRKAATTMLQAVHATADDGQGSPNPLSPGAPNSVCAEPLNTQTHRSRTSTSPNQSATIDGNSPMKFHFPSVMETQLVTSISSAKSSTASITYTMDQEPGDLGIGDSIPAQGDDSGASDHVFRDAPSDDEENDNQDDDDDDDDNEDDDEEEEEKHCALAPLQSHLAMSMAYSHFTRTRYNLAPVAAPAGLTATPLCMNPNQTASMQQPQPFPPLGREQTPNFLLTNSSPPEFPPNSLVAPAYPGSATLSGGLAQPVTPAAVYGLPSDPHSAAAAAAASLMLLRPGDDDEDLAEIDRVNQRLAMGKLNNLVMTNTFGPSEQSPSRSFGPLGAHPSTQTLPDQIDRN